MPVIQNNNFSNDTYGIRTERLIAIQGNLASIQTELQAPANIVTWSVDCNDIFSNLLAVSQLEMNESEGATAIVVEKENNLTEIYQNVKTMGTTIYNDTPEYLKDYGFENAFPIRRDDKFRAVDTVLLAFARHKAASVTPLIPELMITRLTAARDAFKDAIEVQDKERSDARHSVSEVSKRYESDTSMLNQLKSWWFMMMGKKDERITLIGMVNPSAGGGGGMVPDPPEELRIIRIMKCITWNVEEDVTSYELMTSEDNVNFTPVDFGSRPEYYFETLPLVSYWKVRARNSHGYSEFSPVIRIEWLDVLPAPANFVVNHDPSITNGVIMSWEPVFSAATYMVSKASAPIGSTPSSYTILAETPDLTLKDVGVAGWRMFYKLQSRNDGQASELEIRTIDMV